MQKGQSAHECAVGMRLRPLWRKAARLPLPSDAGRRRPGQGDVTDSCAPLAVFHPPAPPCPAPASLPLRHSRLPLHLIEPENGFFWRQQ
jgi:hypothetical protein